MMEIEYGLTKFQHVTKFGATPSRKKFEIFFRTIDLIMKKVFFSSSSSSSSVKKTKLKITCTCTHVARTHVSGSKSTCDRCDNEEGVGCGMEIASCAFTFPAIFFAVFPIQVESSLDSAMSFLTLTAPLKVGHDLSTKPPKLTYLHPSHNKLTQAM